MTDRRWSLPSNRGMENLECEVVESTDREMVCRFTLVGEYWNRAPEEGGRQLRIFALCFRKSSWRETHWKGLGSLL